MKRYFFIGTVICIGVGFVFGQEPKYPFPQKITYPYGIMPTKQDSLTKHAAQWYANWKKKYLQECSGNIRPGVDPLNKSLVEAQGFSMVAVAYMGEKDILDKLYNFYRSKVSGSSCGLMNWKVNCTGVESNGAGAATDGDIDVACALIVADWQWPGDGYDKKARDLVKTLEGMVLSCSGLLAVYPGCNGNKWGGCNETDISYYTPAFFRYFANYSDNPDMWKKLADDTQTIRDNAANKTTGLVPDWQSVDGRAGSGSRSGNFAFDAIRAPYKQTMDFLWNGTKKAEAWCQLLTNWAYKVGPENITDGYTLSGSQSSSNKNLASLGSIAVAAMANTQEILDDFVEEALSREDDYWYSGYLGNLYLLALSGNMWNPEIMKNKVATAPPSFHKALPNGTLRMRLASGGRTLVVSGVYKGGSVTLTSLAGHKVTTAYSTGQYVTMDVAMVPSGCYLISNINHQGRIGDSRVVSIHAR